MIKAFDSFEPMECIAECTECHKKIGIITPGIVIKTVLCNQCGWKQDDAKRAKGIDDYLTRIGFGESHKLCRFENFKTLDGGLEKAVGMVKGSMPDRGVFLFGPPGSGKTHLVAAQCYSLSKDFAIESIRVHILELIRHSRKHGDETDTWIDKLCNVQHLVLDDIGMEKPSEWTFEILNLIINRRSEAMRMTSYTANFSLEKISETLGDRVASRISESCVIISMAGASDYRTRQKEGV